MSLFYKISFNSITSHYISGWCYHCLNKEKKIELALYLNDVLLEVANADLFREDLRELGIHPTGCCGFEFEFNNALSIDDHDILSVVDKKNNKLLAKINGADFSTASSNEFTKVINNFNRLFRRNRNQILFMHIPKTAGTSFNTYIRSLAKYNKAISHIEAINEKDYDTLLSKYNYISGHLRYGVFNKYFCNSKNEIYTLIREPYARLHSHLNWMIRDLDLTSENSLKIRKPAIYNLRQKLRSMDFTNPKNLELLANNIQGVEASFFDNLQTRYFLLDRVEKVSEQELEQALLHAGKFKLIGLTEQYSDFTKIFNLYNKLNKPNMLSNLNRTTMSPLFDSNDSEVRNLLLPLVHYDLKLYEDVRNSFQSKVEYDS